MLALRRPDGSEWQLSETDLAVIGNHVSAWLQRLPASLTIQGREFFVCAFPDGEEIGLAYACPDFWPPIIGPTDKPGEYALVSIPAGRDPSPDVVAATAANAALSIEQHIHERLSERGPAALGEGTPCA
jgi:hypothetical protein